MRRTAVVFLICLALVLLLGFFTSWNFALSTAGITAILVVTIHDLVEDRRNGK